MSKMILIEEAKLSSVLEALEWNMDYLPSHGHGTSMASKAISALRETLAEQTAPMIRGDIRDGLVEDEPAQRKYCRGDRLICLETEEYCVIHISGTDRQWVKFPDTHIGVYKNEQLAELFELLPKEIEIEQPASKPWVGLTDEEVLQIRENLQAMEGISLLDSLTKAIEAKLREKNA